MAKDTRLAIVIPCYNEEGLIYSTTDRLIELMDDLISREKISPDSYIFLVNDGSKDKTWYEIQVSSEKHKGRIKAAKFSRNFGNQKALLAGMLGARKIGCDAVITIDADLQQDETKIEEFVEKYDNGCKVVFGIRNDRKTDGFIKKITALAFYKLMNSLGVNIIRNHSEYRLVSKEALDVLSRFEETDLFLRGFFHEIGFKTDVVNFDVKPREVGKSKFNLLSLTGLAINGITSYSIVPLKMICVLGILSMLFGFVTGLVVIYAKLVYNDSPNGWSTAIVLISFFGGMQLFCLGIVGEYLGQIFREVKHRPRYLVEEEIL